MTKTTEENLSQSKYAEHRNVTKGYISRMVKEGRLPLIKGKLYGGCANSLRRQALADCSRNRAYKSC